MDVLHIPFVHSFIETRHGIDPNHDPPYYAALMCVRIITIIGVLITFITGCATQVREPSKAPTGKTDHQPQIIIASPVPEPKTQVRTPTTPPPPPKIAYLNLWDRVRAGFALPELDHKYVDHYIRWYLNHPDYLTRMLERAEPYLFYIVEQVEKHGMPLEIAILPAIESAFKPTAYSRAKAAGLWQFIPATGRRYGLKQNWWYDGRRDVVLATQAALSYLEFLNDEFNGDWFHTLAAYNAGESRIRQSIRNNIKRKKPTDYSRLSLKTETRHYVPKLLALKKIIEDSEKFSLRLPAIPNKPYFHPVDIDSQIDLSVAGKLAEVPIAELRRLNPGFKRWATDPDGPHILQVPLANKDRLIAGLRGLPTSERLRWERYLIREGDTLGKIAQRYGVTVTALQTSNRLKSTLIRAGHTLLIPVSSGKQTPGDFRVAASTNSPTTLGRIKQPTVHRVRNGDTLWAIAKRYKVYVNQLARWNAITADDLLRLGQRILVYAN